MRTLAAFLCFWLASPLLAQDFNALARVDPAESGMIDTRRGAELVLYLSQPVPWRVFTLEEPNRLVVDFREVDWRGLDPARFTDTEAIEEVRAGAVQPGWSRLVLTLAAPLAVRQAGMDVTETDGTARVRVELAEVGQEDFSSAAGPLALSAWEREPAPIPEAPSEDRLVVVIDPGHGGVDPGAEYDGLREADLMLTLGRELVDSLSRSSGVAAFLTREGDVFVPLQERMSLARALGADLFISLHADALEGVQASGATIYTLSDAAADAATQRMAERHERGDLLAGVDLTGQGDEIATVLMDLARQETGPAGQRFADTLEKALQQSGAPLAPRPRREALLAVLTSADFPAVLLEVGFLSNEAERQRLGSAQGRAPIVEAVTRAVSLWALEEEALAPLIRQ